MDPNQAINWLQALAQGGIVVILLAFIGLLALAIRYVFKAYVASNERILVAIEASTKSTESHTRALDDNARASDNNRTAIEAMKATIDGLQLFLHSNRRS